ncbi:hypothetical protein B6D12_09775 [Gilliamella apicola]|nr:hypothetical protein B5S41_08710 [Gilliamella apicola]OTP97027.1 hypothetical protein B6D05_02610 [Gilliamella apicola]OTQ04767.1 hypothetical protein B6D12_09775 [Gilliamella apicola]OTQ19102.1 hypothetical protein B6D15_03085 [Gilliamella apicola]OTQ20927.1 hypothetical protein B6D16_02680 [Gilliamella apicola]
MGKSTLQLSCIKKPTHWQIKLKLLSQSYAIRWDELLTIKYVKA